MRTAGSDTCASLGAGGRSKFRCAFATDRRRCFVRKIVKLNTKILLGGGQKLCNLQKRDRRASTAHLFGKLRKFFFFGPGRRRVPEILSRNSGWGGGRRKPWPVTQ